MSKTPRPDALDLLTADHAQAGWRFETFKATCERNASVAEKTAVAEEICYLLSIQGQLEEEIFYPSVRPGLDDASAVDAAERESLTTKDLIAEICAMTPAEPLYNAKMAALQATIKRRMRIEQQEMFPKVRETNIDLASLAVEIQNRKSELLAQDEGIRDRLEREDESADPVGPPPSVQALADKP